MESVSVRRIAVLTAAVAVLSVGLAVRVSAQSVDEAALKAAYLLNFIALTEWPLDVPHSPQPVTACIAAPAVADAFIEMVRAKKSGGRAVTLRRVQNAEIVGGCSLLFLSRGEGRRYDRWLAAIRGATVLSVGESPDFIDAGGMASFFIEDGRMRFAINLPVVEASQLRLSSKLLSLAKIIRSRGGH